MYFNSPYRKILGVILSIRMQIFVLLNECNSFVEWRVSFSITCSSKSGPINYFADYYMTFGLIKRIFYVYSHVTSPDWIFPFLVIGAPPAPSGSLNSCARPSPQHFAHWGEKKGQCPGQSFWGNWGGHSRSLICTTQYYVSVQNKNLP